MSMGEYLALNIPASIWKQLNLPKVNCILDSMISSTHEVFLGTIPDHKSGALL